MSSCEGAAGGRELPLGGRAERVHVVAARRAPDAEPRRVRALDVGSVTVIAFGTEPVVDLWWATSGCQSIDNGSVVAHQLANPSFGGFQAAFARVAR